MRQNYHAWNVDIEKFPAEKGTPLLEFLIRFAVLAPSSHNSQPWKFQVSDHAIRVIPDHERRLAEGDAEDHLLYISLGCAVENILIAADYYGLRGTVAYFPDGENGAAAAEITFSSIAEKSSEKDHLIFEIPRRVNNRNKYSNRALDGESMAALTSTARDGVEVRIVSDPDTRYRLADVALASGIAAMESKFFRHELSRHVKSNVTRSHIGMPAFGMGIPTPISFFAPRMIKFLNMNRLSFKSDEQLLKKHTPSFGVILTPGNTKKEWMLTGEIYERIGLIASRLGISLAAWAAPVQIGDYYKEVQSVLGTSQRPQMFFRIGYTEKITKHSPRIPAEKVIQRS